MGESCEETLGFTRSGIITITITHTLRKPRRRMPGLIVQFIVMGKKRLLARALFMFTNTDYRNSSKKIF
jgi:hypothetical protein